MGIRNSDIAVNECPTSYKKIMNNEILTPGKETSYNSIGCGVDLRFGLDAAE
jgi:hypothetical protein